LVRIHILSQKVTACRRARKETPQRNKGTASTGLGDLRNRGNGLRSAGV